MDKKENYNIIFELKHIYADRPPEYDTVEIPVDEEIYSRLPKADCYNDAFFDFAENYLAEKGIITNDENTLVTHYTLVTVSKNSEAKVPSTETMEDEQISCIESLIKEALMQHIIMESGDIFSQKFDNGNLLEGIKQNLSSNGIELEDDEIVRYMEKAALPILMEVYFKECFYMCGTGKDEKVGIYTEKVKKWINRFSNDISEIYKREYEA